MLNINTPTEMVEVEKAQREQAIGTGEIAQSSIPLAIYASMRVQDDAIHIAETSKNTLIEIQHAQIDQDATTVLLTWLKDTAKQHHTQFIAASVEENDQFKDIISRLWLQEDIVPYLIRQQDPAYQQRLEEQLLEVSAQFDENNIVRPHVDEQHEVRVSELVTLDDYQKITSPEDFALLQTLACAFEGKKLVFINATPQGGGVALMRHALIRLLRLLHVDVHWYVLIPKKEAFDITKAKFHNVLQAVASPTTELTQSDKSLYDAWMKENAEALDDVFKQANVIVIDDPQPTGLIPYIKQANPAARIIYRSHIQIVGSLASQPGTPQYTTWQFIWNNVQHADCFISHPMKKFIPDDVPAEKIFYMPATTDALDGLNKPLSEEQQSTYMQLFNALLVQAQQTPLDEKRPYIIQVARFDPSKGIPDVLEAYKKLREKLEQQGNTQLPQLVITGNSSVDDPDGVPVYTLITNILKSEPYVHFADDIKVLRLPHRDQILNTLLRKSAVVLQLSIKEGFEVKVTEALMKQKPVIAYRVGGIPLQIEDGVTGHLVDIGDTTQVAQHLYTLLTDESTYQSMCKAAGELANKDYLTIPNAICWLYMGLQLLKGEPVDGQYQWVKALAQQQPVR